jgi:hypothetical protein
MRMTRARGLFGLALIAALLGMVAYGLAFSGCIEEACPGVVLPYNIPDHQNYLGSMLLLETQGAAEVLKVNHGVALVYRYAGALVDEDPTVGATRLSYAIDLLLYLLCLHAVLALRRRLGVPLIAIVPLALFPPFFFFSGLINKDILLMFLLPASVLALQQRRYVLTAVIAVAIGMTRLQYVVFPLLTWYLMRGSFGARLAIAYAVMALGSAVIARTTAFFEIDSTGLGLSDFIYQLNKQYLVGALIFNPLRVVQYVLALAGSWRLVAAPEGINLMALSEGLAFFWFLALLPGLWRVFRCGPAMRRERGWRTAVAPVLAYLMIMLLTAITEPRYLMPLYPLALLAAAYPKRRMTPAPAVARARDHSPAPGAADPAQSVQ